MFEQAFKNIDDVLHKEAECSSELDYTEQFKVVGIDVGGMSKGFHAVALVGGKYSQKFHSTKVSDIVNWCLNTVGATAIAVDAPCRWSIGGHSRPAEQQLMKNGISCFSTPTLLSAKMHPSNHFGWMLRGAELFRELEKTHHLWDGLPSNRSKFCLETFPHAITWHLRGGNASASQKRTQRRALLKQAGIDLTNLTNIDLVDAALCALTAHHAASGGEFRSYGEKNTGLIFAPFTMNIKLCKFRSLGDC